jgi:hypothetical protein
MNAHEAAARNAKGVLVRAGKAYDRTFEVRLPLPQVAKRCAPLGPRAHIEAPTRPQGGKGYRINRWTQEASVASIAPRARGSQGSGNISSMFGRPLARCEG